MQKICVFLLLIVPSFLFAQTISLDSIRKQMEYAAKEMLIEKYYPRNLDTVHGGYLSEFTYDFKPTDNQDKMIVTQSRHIWSTSKAAEFYNDTAYISMARHGYYFLRDKMWDKVHGGFHNLVTREGEAKSTMKEAYGNSFAIYGLAAYYHASGDTGALNLAKKTFLWLEKNSHDAKYKGYFQHLNADGSIVKRTADIPSTENTGYKDQNSSIHLLEAFTELYQVWKDPLVKARLNEMLVLTRDVITTPKGYLQLFLTPNWKAVTYNNASRDVILKHRGIDHVSFGHDVETAYLMMEASEVLGIHNDKKTLAIGKKMVDHALRNGWDDTIGGFYDEGYYFKNKPSIEIILDSKNWWAQAEGLNTLLIMSRLYPDDKMNYLDKFIKQWRYIDEYLLDHEHGDWYEYGLDKVPEAKTRRKTHIWKGSYHSFRALANCINLLRNDAKPAASH